MKELVQTFINQQALAERRRREIFSVSTGYLNIEGKQFKRAELIAGIDRCITARRADISDLTI